ncbi:MAG TPA: PLDc N-terminal domain-containing protein, partial [Cyclobacteriaceae bacterium]|nr:PLDc N-terminal domain-containing protein [Cyclobacteriaceae bacterium]
MERFLIDQGLLLAIIYTLLIFFAWIDIYKREKLSYEHKIQWGLLVYFLPVIGIALYLIISRKIFKSE